MSIRRNSIVTVVGLLILVLVLWLPFGFNIGFWHDGWTFFDKVNTARLLGAFPPAPASRPAINIVWMLAFLIDSDSYVGINLLVLALIFVKGLLCAAILYRLTRQAALALAFAALVVLFPAETGIFYLGAATIHVALVCWLAATYLVLNFYDRPRLSTALAVCLALIVAVSSYEVCFLFVPIGLAALWAKVRRFDRRFVLAAAAYILVPTVMAIRYALLWSARSSGVDYQNSLIDASVSVSDMIASLARAYARHFVGGWFGEGLIAFAPFAAVSALLIGGICLGLIDRGRSAGEPTAPRLPPAALIAAGLVMIPLGIALFLPTVDRDSSVRTYYFSTLGAALVFAAGAWWLTRSLKQERAFAVIIGALVLLGCWRLLEQHADYQARSAAQQQVIAQIVELVPQPQPNMALIIYDQSTDKAMREIFTNSLFMRSALSVIYDTYSLAVGLCFDGEPVNPTDSCNFTPQTVQVYFGGDVYFEAAYSRIIVLTFDGDTLSIAQNDAELPSAFPAPVIYDPTPLILSHNPPRRAETMLPAHKPKINPM